MPRASARSTRTLPSWTILPFARTVRRQCSFASATTASKGTGSLLLLWHAVIVCATRTLGHTFGGVCWRCCDSVDCYESRHAKGRKKKHTWKRMLKNIVWNFREIEQPVDWCTYVNFGR